MANTPLNIEQSLCFIKRASRGIVQREPRDIVMQDVPSDHSRSTTLAEVVLATVDHLAVRITAVGPRA